ncbi:relaxin receptor 2-like [Pomacea canaliculata]|uniref:relaxin receptor 2-like n=1 Tax=Pomacea canaliculata TaxID=400727 RepID=UPI000D72CE6B|nr:relaxin receptor 2-like [Pomacea canaliculata]
MRCNGVYDCAGGEDETNCETYTCPGLYRCYSSTVCLHPSHVCDGVFQCPQQDDERFCHLTCPVDSCTCQGHAFVCSTVFNVSSPLRSLVGNAFNVTPAIESLDPWWQRGSFVSRFCLNNQASYSVFVINLNIADFVMGIYLAIIGVADQVYRGKYLWHDTTWKTSPVCHVAGFLCLLSTEVSAFIICLITLDRFLVLQFPFSRVRFNKHSAAIACCSVWMVGLVLAAVPLLPVTSHWEFYSQTGICVPLPITRKSFGGHDYLFGVVIVVNLVLFVLIAVGQLIIYYTVRVNSLSTSSNKNTADLSVARRLTSVVVSSFLCFFPVALLGVLAASGTPIPGEVNVAMVIFVLPFNAALNPFLYTFNTVMEKRRRATELRLLKRLESRGHSEVFSLHNTRQVKATDVGDYR